MSHTAVLTASACVYACGGNASGQCGLGHTKAQHTFARVALPGDLPATAVACGAMSTFAAVSDGSIVFACGSNRFGQLGLAAPIARLAASADQLTMERVGARAP